MSIRKFQSGLSLVELLVSIVVALIVLSGVISVVMTSRQTFVSEQEASFIQENQRFAAELLARDIRQAGYTDCAVPSGSYQSVAVSDATGLFGPEAIIGYEGTAGVAGFPSALGQAEVGSDAFIVRYADQIDAKGILSHAALGSNVFRLHSTSNFNDGDLLLVVDGNCQRSAIFQATTVTNTDITQSASGLNCSLNLYLDEDLTCDASPASGVPYETGSMVLPYRAHAYFIDDSNVLPGVPALKRRVFTATGQRTEELAQGVERMEIFYGVDSDGDGSGIDGYKSANQVADWDDVIAVRVTLVLRSQAEFYDSNYAVTIEGIDFNDRYLRKLHSSTFVIRNRSVL